MATITSKASGNWSAASTWDTNTVPTSADTVTILAGHTVVLDVAYVIEGQLTNNGTLTLSADLTLGSGTNQATTKDGIFTFGPSSTLQGTSSLKLRCGKVNSTTTSTSWAFVKGTMTIEAVSATSIHKTNIHVQYISFQTTGNLYFYTGGNEYMAGKNNPACIFDHCVFEGYADLQFGRSGYTFASFDLSITNCDFRGAPKVTAYAASAATGTGLRVFRGNTAYSPTARSGFVFSGVSTYPVTLDSCACVNHGCISAYVSANPVIMKDSFVTVDGFGTSAVSLFYGNDPSAVEGSYFSVPNVAPMNVNPHGLQCTHSRNSIFEIYGSEPNTFFLANYSVPTEITGNLFVGNGDAVNSLKSDPLDAIIKNNTVVRFETAAESHGVGGLYLSENATATIKTIGRVFRNNLHAGIATTPYTTMMRVVGCTAQVDSDYNAYYNTTTRYAAGVTNLNTGEHDFVADPMFSDSTRSSIAWINSVTGSTTKTYVDVNNAMLARNGYDAATKTQIAANVPAHTLSDLMAYMRAGFTPYNMNLATRGEDGAFVGAYAPKVIPTFTATIVAQEKQ